MKVLLINSVCGVGSTGKICGGIAQKLEAEGHEVKIAYGRDGTVPEKFQRYAVRIGTDLDVKIHGIRSRLLDDHCFASRRATKAFLQWAQEFDPELLWLHNIHGYYLNMELLFGWIKSRPGMQVKWTFHDCWPFTGHCAYFTMAGCDKWKTGCGSCPQKKGYPTSMLLDRSGANFQRKKELFTGVKDMTIITPSQWLADLVKESFLGEYPVEVHYNTIDTTVFKPTEGDFRQKYGLEDKKIVLGVANIWDARKGLEYFVALRKMLSEDVAIVLVGLSQKQIETLPDGMIGITRTQNQVELAQIYTAADVFVNPSREETFGLTTVEAVACGTPAIVFKNTACEEVVNQFGGVAVDPNVDAIYSELIKLIC